MTVIELPPIPARLIKAGWDPEPYDICWLDCAEIGYRLLTGGWETVLCANHASELESSAQLGYSLADPPADSRAKWWPWRPVDSDREASGLRDPFQ